MFKLSFSAANVHHANQKSNLEDVLIIFFVLLIMFLLYIAFSNQTIEPLSDDLIKIAIQKYPREILDSCIIYVVQEAFAHSDTPIKIAIFGKNIPLPVEAIGYNELFRYIIMNKKVEQVVSLIPNRIIRDSSVFIREAIAKRKESDRINKQNETKNNS